VPRNRYDPKRHCGVCQGWQRLYRQTVILYGSGKVQSRSAVTAGEACQACKGTGLKQSDDPPRGTPPVLGAQGRLETPPEEENGE
jgi:hypothetical protein|tara:strand:- start:276 stop:530 length:255 start_codon:yes stop_codon:yes gene_type:complete